MNASLSLTRANWLRDAEKQLTAAGIATARLDCLVLLEDILGKDRTHVLAHPDENLTNEHISQLNSCIKRRLKHEPLAYIRGKSEFYGREFFVTADTLEPRPETETMLDLLKQLDGIKTIADVGTGSGCIGITAKLELKDIDVYATEINAAALSIAKQNAKKHAVAITFHQGNLLEPLEHVATDVIVANLPYVPDNFTINEAAMQEPKIAIFGGPDGLNLYRQLFEQIDSRIDKPRFVLTESLPFQHHGLATIARHYGYVLQQSEDFIQVFST